MECLSTIAGDVNIRQITLHLSVHFKSASDPSPEASLRPKSRVRLYTDCDQGHFALVFEIVTTRNPEAVGFLGNPVDFDAGPDLHAITFEFPTYSCPEFRIHCGQDGRCTACNGYLDAAMRQRICHLQSDVSSPNYHRSAWLGGLQITMNGEAVMHCVKGKDAWRLPTVDRRLDWAGASSNDKPVIGEGEEVFTRSTDIDGLGIGVDAGRPMTTAYLDALEFSSMSEDSPIGGFAA